MKLVIVTDGYLRFGGSGTTATTFIYILWGCLQKPEVTRRLQEELRAAFPDRDAVPDYRVRYLPLPNHRPS